MSRELVIAPSWIGHSGLWTLDGRGTRREIDAEEIGLSDDTADRLETWIDSFDAIYDEADESASAFASSAEEAAWLAEGETVADAISRELGAGWTIQRDFTGWKDKAKP